MAGQDFFTWPALFLWPHSYDACFGLCSPSRTIHVSRTGDSHDPRYAHKVPYLIFQGTLGWATSLLRNFFLIFLLAMSAAPCIPAGAAPKSPHLNGAWTISWQARVGMERGTIQIQQKGSHLTGVYQGHGKPGSLSGVIKDGNISFNLEFQTDPPYTIVFKGTIDGDKMAGKFDLQGFKDPYDQHGENVQAIDYSWSASRLPDSQKHPSQDQKPAH